MLWLASSDPLSHVIRHDLSFHGAPLQLGPIIVSNQMLMAVVAAVLMLALFPVIFGKPRPEAPGGLRNFFEAIMEFLRVEVFRPALKEHTDRFVPFLWTMFFFILFCNLLGQIPFAEIITLFTGKASHLGGTATGTVTTTGALAVMAFLFIHLNGILQVARSLMDGTYGHHGHHEEHSADGNSPHETALDLPHVRSEGLPADVPQNMQAVGHPVEHYHDDEHAGHPHEKPDRGEHGATAHGKGMALPQAALMSVPLYLWNFAPHPFKPGPGESAVKWIPDIFMWGMLLILELIGAMIKPFALMIRLFANMIAGHIVLAAFIALIPLGAGIGLQLGIFTPVMVLSLMIRMLELFVAFLQAYIFTFLTTLFIASAVAPEH